MIIETLAAILSGILASIIIGRLVYGEFPPLIRRRLGIWRYRRAVKLDPSPRLLSPLSPAARLDLVAAAIAETAGHNWAADMMPEYRAEFRRQARAAIAVQEGALWR